jgi:hypothetical protein
VKCSRLSRGAVLVVSSQKIVFGNGTYDKGWTLTDLLVTVYFNRSGTIPEVPDFENNSTTHNA